MDEHALKDDEAACVAYTRPGMERIWLHWDRPLVPDAAAWLIERGESRGGSLRNLCELSDTLCVVPGRRGGRVLVESLVRVCDERGLHLVPPRIVTPGALIDELDPPETPHATETECIFAWINVLSAADVDSLQSLLPRLDDSTDLLTWRELASMIHRLHKGLAGERKTFNDAAAAADRLDLQAECERWHTLTRLHAAYIDMLASCGLADPYEKGNFKFQTSNFARIVLIGIAELNGSQRAALEQCSDRVVALVHAPQDRADDFDALGCVKTEEWESAALSVQSEHIIVAETPDDQADAALREAAAESRTHASDEITLGLGDASLAPALDVAARWAGCAIHHPDGTPLSETPPFRLLRVFADWLAEPRFAHFAAMLRHPDLETWLRSQLDTAHSSSSSESIDPAREDWLTLLDRYFTDHLTARVTGDWLGSAGALKQLHEAVCRLLRPLMSGETRALHEWTNAVRDVLVNVYGQTDGDERTALAPMDACRAIQTALVELESAHDSLQPRVTSDLALRLVLGAAAGEMIPSPMWEKQIEALGWLELHLDPAPALILLGVNEGHVPESIIGDAFLPDQLRTALGLTNNARRAARDAYLLEAIIRSRSHVRLITGRRSASGEPQMPSRLLLRCVRSRLPQRVRMVTDAKRAHRARLPAGAMIEPHETRFTVPLADPRVPIPETMSVTSFKTYLACPFCFWLHHVLKLRSVDDSISELDPMRYGSLAHIILQDFGQSEPTCDSANPDEINAFLQQRVDELAAKEFGKAPLPAVHIQLARLRTRLEGFARFQAAHRAEGWIIRKAEYKLPEDTTLDMPGGEPMRITGIIDRIDEHELSGRYRIIDYKTGESPTTPMKAHRGKERFTDGEWIDLQLPLYRHLAAQHGFDGEVELGFITLPKNPDDVAFISANWTDAQRTEAIDLAREVVRAIRRGEFERNPDALGFEEFANILHLHSLGEREDAGGDE